MTCWKSGTRQGWRRAIGYPTDISLPLLDIASRGWKMWVASWSSLGGVFDSGAITVVQLRASLVQERDAGPFRFLRGAVTRTIDTGEWAPHFIAPASETLLHVTALANVKLTGGASRKAVHQASDGALLRIEGDEIAVLAGDLAYPSGVLLAESVLFVADYATGELHSYDLLGKRISTYGGLEGPMGLARARNGDICVAEPDAGRVTCLSSNLLQSTGEGFPRPTSAERLSRQLGGLH